MDLEETLVDFLVHLSASKQDRQYLENTRWPFCLETKWEKVLKSEFSGTLFKLEVTEAGQSSEFLCKIHWSVQG